MKVLELNGWNRLRHGGLLLDPQRLSGLAEHVPPPLPAFSERELRRFAGAILEDSADISEFVSFVLQKVCSFTPDTGKWERGPQVGSEWSRRAITGEAVKPRQVWRGEKGGILPVFIDTEKRLGIGRGRRSTSQVVQWLRGNTERLALLTNGRQWRLIFAGLDFDAWAEWDVELWFEEGALSPQVFALRTLFSPMLWTPPDKDSPSPLLKAILESRKGQAELSAVLGERVREAVEILVQAHGEVLKERCADVPPAHIYQVAVRVVMRMVVILFAESRELLPRENAIYHGAYGLTGLLEELEKVAARGGNRLARSWNAWPRLLALFRLVHQGSHHTALPAPAYGGELFAPGNPAAGNALEKVLSVFETACFERELMSDKDVRGMLEHLTRTRVKLRQGRSSTWVPSPVDFSDLSSEYIGILYEGLLDFELKTAPSGDPVVFLAVGNQPALPLSRLEAMDDKAIENLLEKMKDTSRGEDTERESEAEEVIEEAVSLEGAESGENEGAEEEIEGEVEENDEGGGSDERHTTRTRAEKWARRAVVVGKLAGKPKGALRPEKRLIYEETIGRKARQLVTRVILPGEWYLVRWGGTRKGAGTFYTRPGLAVPTVHRTLRPLCYEEVGTRNEELGGENEGFSRIGGMAAGHGVMRGNLPGGGQAAGTGTLRSYPANSEGGGLGAVEHRGGSQPPVNGRLSASPSDGSGIGGRDPNSTDISATYGDDPPRYGYQSDEPGRRMHENAGHAHQQAQEGMSEKEIGTRNEKIGTRNEEQVIKNENVPLDPHSSFLVPKKPEAILALKVCDPACGSGTFPVAALRFLTEALYASLHHHDRIKEDGERAVVRLLSGTLRPQNGAEERLGDELLPCRTEDPLFEQRLKAVLRRYIVERCIYGVDLDPLAVELCRLSLWIETMDRDLPFSFLDHKIKCGNSLVGAWFDQFQHYPIMAWKNKEGGDKNHFNGVHFKQEARTRAIKAFVKDVLTSDLCRFLQGKTLFEEDLQEKASKVHEDALTTLSHLHNLPIHDSAERARIYRDEFIGSDTYQSLKTALDLWCACWFWPANELVYAPLPSTMADPSKETLAIAQRVADKMRFFHWELEFPDVFRGTRNEEEGTRNEEQGSKPSSTSTLVPNSLFLVPNSPFLFQGFDAMIGNPPWDIAKPSSKEFFSNIDPLYRSYGKQEALRYQSGYFADHQVELEWLDYSADFRAQSNFMAHAISPFGDPAENDKSGDRFSIARGKENDALHARWRDARVKSRGFADPAHPFRHQGSADINLYKLFLEQVHALLREGGRMGFIVPSGLYSDHGTGGLRKLFLDHCRWEWLFGFENRDKVFEIDSRFKFNPIIIQKGGKTESIRTAFMRRKLEDWERAESMATSYTRAQVERFSPRSKAILEIQSQRDLEILEKIYANSVLLGDDGPDGWGIKYATEFHMTNDSHLFPPRPKWEADGYRPDEYSRWLKGDWRPIAELWDELGIGKERGRRNEERESAQIEGWLFDSHATDEEQAAHGRFVHGHLLKPGDVQRTPWRLRCAQPPYDTLPIPRVQVPPGIILSREANAWIKEDRIEDVALPLYEGRMIGQFDFSQKGWVSGKGRTAVWHDVDWTSKRIEPQYLLKLNIWFYQALSTYFKSFGAAHGKDQAEAEKVRLTDPEQSALWWWARRRKVAFIDVSSATNTRTMFSTALAELPCGNSAPILTCNSTTLLPAILNSLVYDTVARFRCGGVHLNWFVIEESTLPPFRGIKGSPLAAISLALSFSIERMAEFWIELGLEPNIPWRNLWALSDAERLRLRCALDAAVACRFGMDELDVTYLLNLCDHPNPAASSANPKGFWRVDKDKDPELRHTVLTLVAFHDLEEKIHKCGGDLEKGIEAFFSQNNGEGWMLPETLRLADYGLGHDERAKVHQPVASRLGPRFYDWQLVQSSEESWRECHLHARNLLGESGYFNLLSEVLRETAEGGWREALTIACELSTKNNLLRVFEAALGSLPSASWRRRLDEIKPIMAERGFTLGQDELIQLIVEALKRIPLGERPDGLKVCRDLLGDDGHRTVVRRLLTSELHNPDGPWHLLASKQLDGPDYHALLAELESENHGKLAESAAPYDVSKGKRVQLRLFD